MWGVRGKRRYPQITPCPMLAHGQGGGVYVCGGGGDNVHDLSKPVPETLRISRTWGLAKQEAGLGRERNTSHSQVDCHRCHWPPFPECWHLGVLPAGGRPTAAGQCGGRGPPGSSTSSRRKETGSPGVGAGAVDTHKSSA